MTASGVESRHSVTVICGGVAGLEPAVILKIKSMSEVTVCEISISVPLHHTKNSLMAVSVIEIGTYKLQQSTK